MTIRGWAIVVGAEGKAHLFRPDSVGRPESLCGIHADAVVYPRQQPKCKRCEARLRALER